ncbi:hypothetical protein MKW98_027109 [Papaver atlanticum]|uniref:KIB1-4 beta-propeller domain-containing protein n=1 Tax=Papaver atlanticum TaxID=357466 RepID=A0AAD4X8H0_9MAGN|nr:hypothetical protein MKW98_027109 [Papaver atlanticum]
MGMCGKLTETAIQHGCSEILRISDTRNNFTSVTVAGRLDYVRQSVVMACFGEVFRIDRFYIPRGDYKSLTNIVISKLDFASMAWEEVNSLNDYVFFLSKDSQLCCLASELGLPKGCVYFTQLGEISLYKYDLEDKSVLLCLPCPDLPTPWSSSEWLMIRRIGNSTVTGTSVDKDANKEDIVEVRPSFIDNEDMVRLISDQLHTVDYIHLRAVSKKYRSMWSLRRSSSNKIVRTTDLSPWLVFVNYDQDVYNFVTPMHNNENYLMNIPEVLKGFTVRFSKDGWLLMSKDKTLFFYNPFSKSIVRLPDLPEGCSFSGISFSSLPTSSDCIVFGIDKCIMPDEVSIAFIKRGDKDWTSCSYDNVYLPPNKNKFEFEPNFNNPVFHDGAFYCLDLNGSLGLFSFENDTSWEILAMVHRPNCEFIYKSFLVECEGNLLCVLLGRLGKWVRGFRLNNKEMVWIEVKHLGRHMLCISHTSSISAVAPTRHMENKIYFPRLRADGILFYSLDTGLYHCLGCKHSAKDYGNSKEYLVCSWIEPNCLETTSEQDLDWFNI